MKFGQCHAYTYNFLDPSLTAEERGRHEELVLRSIECCYIVGSRLCVTHPDTDYNASRLMAVSEEKNAAYFRQLLERRPLLKCLLPLKICAISRLPPEENMARILRSW